MKLLLLALLFAMLPVFPAGVVAGEGPAKRSIAGFQRRGFYLHGSWVMEHPFAVRGWNREDFAAMFRLLHHLGYNTVMIWPTPETAPMPLSAEDAATLRGYRPVIDDAKAIGLECWLTYCPSVISKDEVRPLPWKDRSLYASTKVIRLTDEATASMYLRHRQSVLRCLDNADAFVVIDGDPGGYPGAPVEEYLRILKSDQQAVPGKPVIPWVWCGWGTKGVWQEPIEPFIAATLEAIKQQMPEPWKLLPGRCHKDGHGNGRIVVAKTEKAGLMPRSTIMCYEAIEFEPTPPATVLQFDIIRQVLKQESQISSTARGVMGNAQQPVMVLPNLYYFARGAADLSYLDKPQEEVLGDLARELGGDPAVLIPAWTCLQNPLAKIPANLPDRVRSLKLSTDMSNSIPGGPQRYVEIIAAQVQSRRQLLEAVAETPASPEQATASLAKGANALVDWWNVHRYVGPGRKGDPFRWSFVRPSEVNLLRPHVGRCAAIGPDVIGRAADLIAQRKVLSRADGEARLKEIAKLNP